MYILDAILAESAVAHVPKQHFADIGQLLFLQRHIVDERRVCLHFGVDTLIDLGKNVLHRLGVTASDAADIAIAWFHIEFDAGNTRAILPAIVLFFKH